MWINIENMFNFVLFLNNKIEKEVVYVCCDYF